MLQQTITTALQEVQSAPTEKVLNDVRVKYLGKSGVAADLMAQLKSLPNDQKREFGKQVNELKTALEEAINQKNKEFMLAAVNEQLKSAKIVDLTVPATENEGSLHPITIVQHKIEDVFKSMGFVVEEVNEIETEFNNFEAVNVPKHHPARDMQDTFFLSNGQILSTHTSSSQNRVMKKYGAPLKVIFPGRCFRNEELDASHENTFFQVEGMMIDENITVSNLIYFMREMLSKIFKKDVNVRLRPGYFPFVEPGFELDISCPYCNAEGCRVCKHTGWIELCPCGMIHPKVLELGGIDTSKYQGFAFGMGLSRLVMMTYGIDDIRVLNSGNLKTLKQLKIK